jgi:hypothetical protein
MVDFYRPSERKKDPNEADDYQYNWLGGNPMGLSRTSKARYQPSAGRGSVQLNIVSFHPESS